MTEIYLTQDKTIKNPLQARLIPRNQLLFVGEKCIKHTETYIFEEKDFLNWANSHKFEIIPQPVKKKEEVKK